MISHCIERFHIDLPSCAVRIQICHFWWVILVGSVQASAFVGLFHSLNLQTNSLLESWISFSTTVREIIQWNYFRAQLLCQSIHKLPFTLLRMTGVFCGMKWFGLSALGKIGWLCHPISGDLLQTEAQWLRQTPQMTNSADAVLRWTECHWGMTWIQYPHHQKTHAQDTLKVIALCLNHGDLLINYLWFLSPTSPVSL